MTILFDLKISNDFEYAAFQFQPHERQINRFELPFACQDQKGQYLIKLANVGAGKRQLF